MCIAMFDLWFDAMGFSRVLRLKEPAVRMLDPRYSEQMVLRRSVALFVIVMSTFRFSRPCQDRGQSVLGRIDLIILILSTMSVLDRVAVGARLTKR